MKKIIGSIILTSPLQVPSAFADGEVMTMRVTGHEGNVKVPFFPGNDLRGRLRRKATDIITSRSTEKVSLSLYHAMSCGAVTGSPSKDKKGVEYAPIDSIATLAEAKSNVFAGLFGGGFNMVSSGYRVSDMVPAIGLIDEIGMLPEGFSGDVLQKEPYELIEEFMFNRWDDLGKSPGKLMEACDADEVIDWQSLIVDQESVGKDGKTDKSRNALKLSNFQFFKAVIPGTPLAFQMDLKSELSDAQIGLMLLSLKDLANEQALGAASRKGFGRFNAFDLKFYSKDGVVDLFKHSGNTLAPYDIHSDMATYINAFEEESSDIAALLTSISNAMTTDLAKPKK